jgi:carboxypeptidase T
MSLLNSFKVRLAATLLVPALLYSVCGAAQTYPTFQGGYRTVAGHGQHLSNVAAAHPDLAVVIKYGSSWLKVNGRGGSDLNVICLTKRRAGDCLLSPTSSKPRMLVIAEVHARELTTAEVAWRWIDFLVDNYGVDADVTWILDSQEIWVIPLANPDGRAMVEKGSAWLLQRKNVDDFNGTCTPLSIGVGYGVDLNRNGAFHWGEPGASTDPCNEFYRGPASASEPEQQALQNLFAKLWRPQRGSNDGDAAPLSVSGAMVSLHAPFNQLVFPWAWSNTRNGNYDQLRALAFRMSYYNGYRTGQWREIVYASSGTTDDYVYGVFGVPAFTIEMGPPSGACGGFSPSYACVDTLQWPLNRGALLSLAKNTRQPYVTPAGPVIAAATVTPGDRTARIDATANADLFGNAANSVGRPHAQPIARAEAYIDLPPWQGGIPIALAAADGVFDSKVENLNATVSTTNLAARRHIIYLRAMDNTGAWGAVSAAWLTVAPPGVPPAKEIVIDNAAAGINEATGTGSRRTFTGTWCTSTAVNSYGGSSLYSCGSTADTYRWTPNIITAGSYDVYVWWSTHVNRASNVPITVTSSSAPVTQTFNERSGGGAWVLHGRYNFAAGAAGYVEVKASNGQAAADAVKFVAVP